VSKPVKCRDLGDLHQVKENIPRVCLVGKCNAPKSEIEKIMGHLEIIHLLSSFITFGGLVPGKLKIKMSDHLISLEPSKTKYANRSGPS
jgi:hypothetical protein